MKPFVSTEVQTLLRLQFPANTMEHVKELIVIPAYAQVVQVL